MSPPPPTLLITIALSTASTICAFQPAPPSLVISVPNALPGDALSTVKPPKRRMPTPLFEGKKSDEEEITSATVEDANQYGDNGGKVDVQVDWEKIEDDYYALEEQVEIIEDDDDARKSKKKNLIECSTSILLPFSQDVAFDAFSDLTRQPSWCKYLHSVEYIGTVGDGEGIANDNNVPLRKSQWTVGVKGLKFSWTANDTRIVRPDRIEWESASGMKNTGAVEFVPQKSSSSSNATQMNLSFAYVAPRVVSSLFRRSGKIRKYTEEVLLGQMLADFRDVVMKEDICEPP